MTGADYWKYFKRSDHSARTHLTFSWILMLLLCLQQCFLCFPAAPSSPPRSKIPSARCFLCHRESFFLFCSRHLCADVRCLSVTSLFLQRGFVIQWWEHSWAGHPLQRRGPDRLQREWDADWPVQPCVRDPRWDDAIGAPATGSLYLGYEVSSGGGTTLYSVVSHWWNWTAVLMH